MVEITREIRYDSKGARAYEFEIVPNPELDRAIYEDGVEREKARFVPGSFAEQFHAMLFAPRPLNRNSSGSGDPK